MKDFYSELQHVFPKQQGKIEHIIDDVRLAQVLLMPIDNTYVRDISNQAVDRLFGTLTTLSLNQNK